MPSQELATLPTAKDQDFEPFWLRHAFPLPYANSEWTTSVRKWRFLYCSDLRVIASMLAGREAGASPASGLSPARQKKRGAVERCAQSESTARPHETTPTRTKSALPPR